MRYDDCETDDSVDDDDWDERSAAGSVQGLQLPFAALREIPDKMVTLVSAFDNWKWCVRTEGLSEDEHPSDTDGDSDDDQDSDDAHSDTDVNAGDDQGSDDDGYSGDDQGSMMMGIQVMIRGQMMLQTRVMLIVRSPFKTTGISAWCFWSLSIQREFSHAKSTNLTCHLQLGRSDPWT
jgi:hypothetical protein